MNDRQWIMIIVLLFCTNPLAVLSHYPNDGYHMYALIEVLGDAVNYRDNDLHVTIDHCSYTSYRNDVLHRYKDKPAKIKKMVLKYGIGMKKSTEIMVKS